MTVIQYETPAPLPTSRPGDELVDGPTGDVARLRAAAEYAGYIANTDFVPEALRGRPDAIAAAMLAGAEVGLKPMASLRMVAVIKGRPTLTAEAQRGLVTGAGHEIWFEESTVTRATAAGRRAGSERIGRVTWTTDDAKRAGLAGQPNWQRYPAEMLRARASAALARAMFADVTLGIPATEELEGDTDNGAIGALEVGNEEARPKREPTRRRRAVTAPAEPPPPADPPVSGGKTREPVTPTPPADTQPEPPIPPEPRLTAAQSRQIFALMRDVGLTDRDERLAYTVKTIGRPLDSSDELTLAEASNLIEELIARRDNPAKLDVAGGTEVDVVAELAQIADEVTAVTGDERARFDELVMDALERRLVTIRDLWLEVATYRHRLPDEMIEELGGRDPSGRFLWQPLRDILRADEISDLTAHLEQAKPPEPDDIPF